MNLSSSQHAAIRRQLALIPLYVWSIYIWSVFTQQLPFERFRATWRLFRDFTHFYILGIIARRHDAIALYDPVAQREMTAALNVPDHVDALFVPSYGPQVALMFRPLAAFSYEPALVIWLIVSLGLYFAAAFAIWRKASGLRDHKWPLFVAVASAPAMHALLMYGQNTAVALCCFVTAYLCLLRGQKFSAGLAIGMLFYKPQLGLASAIVFVAIRQWRVVMGAAVVAVAQMIIATAYWGWGILPAYGTALAKIPESLAAIEPAKQHLHSWRAFFQLMGFEGTYLTGLTITASSLTIAATVAIWRRTPDLRVRFAALLIATVLASPHTYVYDLVILTPVWVWLVELSVGFIGDSGARGSASFLSLSIYAATLFEGLSHQLRLQPSVVLMVVTMLWLLRFACKVPNVPAFGH
jgi:hypothetical protein